MCSGSEAGLFLRLVAFACHSTLGLRAKKKKKKSHAPLDEAETPLRGLQRLSCLDICCLLCVTVTRVAKAVLFGSFATRGVGCDSAGCEGCLVWR